MTTHKKDCTFEDECFLLYDSGSHHESQLKVDSEGIEYIEHVWPKDKQDPLFINFNFCPVCGVDYNAQECNETEYLTQGVNGKHLQESISQLESGDIVIKKIVEVS